MSSWRFDRGCNVSTARWVRYLTAGRVAAACLLLLVLWLMRPFVFGGEVLYKRDIHLFFVPQAEAFVRILHAGSWPIWNPYISFGQPYLANTSTQIFYPTTWLNLIMQPWTNYTVFATVHLFFSGLGLYFLAIRLGISRVGSIVAAALWTASGPHLSFVDLWHHFTGVSWMPWIFLAADTAMEKATVRHALLLGLALAAQIFAGSADLVAITGLAAGIWIGVRHVRWRKGFRANSRLLGLASLAAVVGLGLSAILWLPTLDVASRSARWGLPDAIRTNWSAHPASFIETLVPDLWSPMRSRPIKALLFDSREPFLQSLYLGLPSLGLVIAAAWSQRRLIRNLLVALLVLTLLVSLGRHGVFYDALVRVLPPLQILRYPVKAMILAAFSWSLLAGLGFDVLRKLEVPAKRWGLKTKIALILLVVAWFSVGGTAVFLWVIGLRDLSFDGNYTLPQVLYPAAWSLMATTMMGIGLLFTTKPALATGRILALGAATIAVGELAYTHRNFFPKSPQALYTHRPDIVDEIGKAEDARVYIYDYYNASMDRGSPRYGKQDLHLESYPEGWNLSASMALAMQMHLSPPTAGRWGLGGAFEPDFTGLYPMELARTVSRLARTEGGPELVRLLQLAGVNFAVTLHEEGFEELSLKATLPGLFRNPIRLHEVPDPLPRAYAVSGARPAGGMDAYDTLIQSLVDPRREIILSEGPAKTPDEAFSADCRIVLDKPDRVRIEAKLNRPGYVVLLDSYDPGWKATVDGRPATIDKANFYFRSVAVEEGHHEVEFVYRPRSLFVGLIVSILSAAGVALLAAATKRRWILDSKTKPSGLEANTSYSSKKV